MGLEQSRSPSEEPVRPRRSAQRVFRGPLRRSASGGAFLARRVLAGSPKELARSRPAFSRQSLDTQPMPRPVREDRVQLVDQILDRVGLQSDELTVRCVHQAGLHSIHVNANQTRVPVNQSASGDSPFRTSGGRASASLLLPVSILEGRLGSRCTHLRNSSTSLFRYPLSQPKPSTNTFIRPLQGGGRSLIPAAPNNS